MYFCEMYSLVEENYLKALFNLSEKTGEATALELSKHLKIKMPTVNSMMKKLAEKDLVQYESYKPFKLTAKGKKQAALVIRKHRLTEMFLVEKMGFGWEEVHEIAEQVEHIHAPKFFAKMDELLNFPKVDPHGSPIPNSQGDIQALTSSLISEFDKNDVVKLIAINNSSFDFLNYLNTKDLKLGTVITILHKEPFDGSITVQYNNRQNEVFSTMVCEKLQVERLTT